MKETNKRFQFAVLALLIVSILWMTIYLLASHNYYSQPTVLDDPILGKMFVSLEPFSSTNEGQQFTAVGIGLFVLWCIAIYPPNHWKRKLSKIVALMLLLSLSLMVFPVQAHEWISINVLCAGDEEFIADPNNIDRVEDAVQLANTYTSFAVQDSFETTFNIHFEIVGWISWDSRDWVSDARKMATEVWTETGFESGMKYKGHIVHMLLACTGQDIAGYLAVSFPDASLVLIEEGSSYNYGVIRHEFSHQFYCEECIGFCVMNKGCIFHIPPRLDWCSNCEDWVNAHKFKWPSATKHHHSGGGGGQPKYFYPR